MEIIRDRVDLGYFAAGEVPPPIEVTFEEDGVGIDLTGYTVTTTMEGPGVSSPSGTTTLQDAAAGIVRYTPTEDDTAVPGEYGIIIWAENAPIRYASKLLVWQIYDGPGVTPDFP